MISAVVQQSSIERTNFELPNNIIFRQFVLPSGNELAGSTACYTLYARTSVVTEGKSEIELGVIAESIAQIVDSSKDKILSKITSETSYVTVAKYLDKENRGRTN